MYTDVQQGRRKEGGKEGREKKEKKYNLNIQVRG